MSRTRVALLASVLLVPLSATAAEVTRIASSFEEKDPFGMFLTVGYERTQSRSKIVREYYQQGESQDVTELFYTKVDQRLNLDLRLGLWQDLEFHYRLPIVFGLNQDWRYSAGTDDSNSTIANNCLQANGALLDPNCPQTGAGEQPIWGIPNASYRGGLGNMTFGLAYAFFHQDKDDTKPTWIIGFDYEAPTADRWTPSEATAPDARGRVGDRNHHYTWYISLSRRVGIADPYFKIHYTLPYRASGWYSNCDEPDIRRMGRPENCGTPEWDRSDTGIRLPHYGGILFGTEFNAYEVKSAHQKVAFDLRAIANYTSEGRYMNQLSDLSGKLQYTQEYLTVGGQFGFVAHAAEYVQLSAGTQLTYSTEHTLTDESIGKDTNNNGTVDVTANPRELNPSFDWRTDMVGRRLRATENWNFSLFINATASF